MLLARCAIFTCLRGLYWPNGSSYHVGLKRHLIDHGKSYRTVYNNIKFESFISLKISVKSGELITILTRLIATNGCWKMTIISCNLDTTGTCRGGQNEIIRGQGGIPSGLARLPSVTNQSRRRGGGSRPGGPRNVNALDE